MGSAGFNCTAAGEGILAGMCNVVGNMRGERSGCA